MTLPATPRDALMLHADTTRDILPNGLTLLIRRDRSAPVVSIVTYVQAGYFDEPDDVVGIAHVLEHMYFKGTPTRGVGEIARATKAEGGYLNAHTIYDHTSYYTVLPASAFVRGLEIQFDAYAQSVIDAGELARELEVIIQEAKRKRDTPSAVTIESLYALLHDRHRIRRWRIGEESALRALTRQQLLDFYRAWYCPDNTILAVVGDVDPEIVRREVLARYGALPSGRPTRDRGPLEIALPGLRRREWSGDIAQQQIAFGWRAPAADHPDTPALELAAMMLGAGRASRFYRGIRERQLASSSSAWHYTSGDVGVFVLHSEGQSARAREATEALWHELRRACTHGFTVDELRRVQRITEARWLSRLESMEGQAQYLASWEADGGHERAMAHYEALQRLDVGTVQEALRRVCDPEHVAFVSYRPHGAAPVATDDAEFEGLLTAEWRPTHVPVATGPASRSDSVSRSASGSASGLASPTTVVDDVVVHHTAGGVPVLILPRGGAPLVHVGLYLRGGSLLEPHTREGLARLTAQLTLKGTTTRSAATIAEDIEGLGTSIGVSTGLESLGWSLAVAPRYLTEALAVLADVVQHPVFPEEALATERALAVAELARARDDMYRWPMRLAQQAAFGAHPYARSVIGTDVSLAAISRAEIIDFHASTILTGDLVIGVVGDVEPLAVARDIDRLFATLRQRATAGASPVVWPNAPVSASETRAKQQTALALLFPGPSRHDPDRYAMRVLSAIASGLGGRFFEQLRDRQSLAYTVSAFPVPRAGGGTFAAYIATSPDKEAEARTGLLAECARFVEAAPTDDEVARARQYLMGTHAISQQSAGSVLGDLLDAWLFGEGIAECREEPARIAAVTPDDVHRVAQRWFDATRVVEGIVRGGA